MHSFKSMSLLAMLLVAAPAFAQQRPPVAPSPLRGYLIGGGGASVSSTTSTLTLNAEIAENMTRSLQAYMSVGYYDNIMSDASRNQLQQVGAALSAITGTPWVFSGRDRGRSFTFGAKVLAPGAGAAHPYVGGGLGVLNLRRTIHEQSRGDLTKAYLAQFGSADGLVNATDTDTNRPMAEIAAGVGVVVRKAYIDFGYRYRKTFHNVNQSFNISQLAGAVGVKF
jgi:hypothetical protein